MRSFFIFLLVLILTLYESNCHAQNKVGINTQNPSVTFEVNGKMRVGNDTVSQVPAGTIRFNPQTGDFEGWDGYQWNNFSQDPKESFWPAYQNRGAIGSYIPISHEDAAQGDEFGYAVDIEGNYAVVGSPGWQGNRGRAFVYKREPVFGFWSLQKTLYGSAAITDERFGHSVSISGDKILIGAPKHLNTAINKRLGQAYVFKLNGNDWTQIGVIPNSYCRVEDFGWDVKLVGRQALISSPTVSTDPACLTPVNTNKGEVWFINLDVGYFQTTSLETNVPGISGLAMYGYAVDMDNGWAVVSAPFSTGPTTREDSIYIFKQDAMAPWMWTKKQAFSGYFYDTQVGKSVSIKGETIYVGEPYYDFVSGDNKGALRVFKLDSATELWNESTFRIGEDDNGLFGHSVSLDTGFGLTAAYTDPVNYGVYIQAYDPMMRNHVTITDPLTTSFDLNVSEVSISGRNFIIGLPLGMAENGQMGGRIFFGKIR